MCLHDERHGISNSVDLSKIGRTYQMFYVRVISNLVRWCGHLDDVEICNTHSKNNGTLWNKVTVVVIVCKSTAR